MSDDGGRGAADRHPPFGQDAGRILVREPVHVQGVGAGAPAAVDADEIAAGLPGVELEVRVPAGLEAALSGGRVDGFAFRVVEGQCGVEQGPAERAVRVSPDLDAVLYSPFQVDREQVLVRAGFQGADGGIPDLHMSGRVRVRAGPVNPADRYRVGPGPVRFSRTDGKVHRGRFRRTEQDQAVIARAAVVVAGAVNAPAGTAAAVVPVDAEQERVGQRTLAGLASLHFHPVGFAGLQGDGEPVGIAGPFEFAAG